MKESFSLRFLLACTLFCVCLIASNLLEIKVILIGGITVTAGMIVFPISYILNDCIVEVWGLKKARIAIYTGFAMDFLVMALGGLAVLLPSPDFWEGAEHFNYMFALAPRIVAASLTAFLAGSLLNARVMADMKKVHKERLFPLRATVSTIAGEGADSLIFFPIAFAGTMPASELIRMMWVQALIKTIIEVLILPVTNLAVRQLKKAES